MIKEELLKILCCPKCKSELRYDHQKSTLTCKACAKIYPVKNDIPVLLVDDAE